MNYEKKRLSNIQKTEALLERAGIDKEKLVAIQKVRHQKLKSAHARRVPLVGSKFRPAQEELKSGWRVYEAPFQSEGKISLRKEAPRDRSQLAATCILMLQMEE